MNEERAIELEAMMLEVKDLITANLNLMYRRIESLEHELNAISENLMIESDNAVHH